MKIALITGITGQDGSYLAEFLLRKKYKIIGVMRRTSAFNTERIDHLYKRYPKKFFVKYGDLLDTKSITSIIDKEKPNEIYHLAAQSHVGISFEMPEYTFLNNSLPTLNILEHIRQYHKKIKFYQACSSEMFGLSPPPQNEETKFIPQSPYAISKVSAYYFSNYYKRAFKIFVSTGILFNHESPRRGLNFVTRKITFNICRLLKKEIKILELGDVSNRRDWGYAGDYVEAIWKILQYKKPDNFVISTGMNHTILDFVNECFTIIGLDYRKFVKINVKKYMRPAEVPNLLGDSSKAKRILKFKPKMSFNKLCKTMLLEDLKKNGLTLKEAMELAKNI